MASLKLRVFDEDNPSSVMTPVSALVMALLTLGAQRPRPQAVGAPAIAWHEQVKLSIGGKTVHRFTWRLIDGKLADGTEMKVVVKRWNDPAWLAANPTHEITVLRNGLMNAVHIAKAVRETVPRVRIAKAKGKRAVDSVYIPENASAAEREHYMGILNGTVSPSAKFQPASADGVE